MARISTNDIDLIETPDIDDEGDHLLTTPLKNCRYKNRGPEDEDDEKLKEFIARYKLHKLSRLMFREGITTEFLISQNDIEIKEIATELTSKAIQRNKVYSFRILSARIENPFIFSLFLLSKS